MGVFGCLTVHYVFIGTRGLGATTSGGVRGCAAIYTRTIH